MLLAAVIAALAIAPPRVDHVTDHSARISADAPVRVEYGTSTGYGLYASGGPGVVTLPSLAASTTYHLRIDGGADQTFTTARPAAVSHSLRIGPRRSLLLDGRPFIPIMQWLQCPWRFAAERALGINVFMGRGCSNNGDADEVAQTAALGAYSIIPFDRSVARAPGLLAWRSDDEPDLNHVSVAKVAATTGRGHPRLTFSTITSAFFGPTKKNVPSRAYAAAADVVGTDVYPISGYCRPDLIQWQADSTRELVRLARPRQPVYSWIEAVSSASQWCKGRGVLPAELRAEVWMTLVNGATAIGYFTHSWKPTYTQFRVGPALQRELKRTNRQVTTLTPAILGAPLRLTVRGVQAIGRTYHGARYVFAVNVTHAPVTAAITAGDGTWQVFEERRTVAAAGGVLHDAFAPLAVHLYVLPPAR
ncbi:MAG TPA: hypothetical protein VGK79_13815 [Gaiellaceae bacterium]